ncbi:metal ABC transporter solute-binding protein, Zn/Mn family [Lapidilactobacillus gannanensis]|jgi:iron/zinc/copper transport system substrate-binding protein|uniref:Metal ABC transporter solute-binding protein, Zn/Mn family n=1 Tax=Lapidilactobacillus gannanensis TaxID=2486002 RepID=A0ABW4BKA0_9LACO|nr:zinc ABC transporter substrate-binding protein [Lapidilactobacillus gannanensis]
MKKNLVAIVAVVLMISGVYWFLNQRHHQATSQINTAQKLRVVTTNSILEDMAHNVGQDRIELYSIVKRGTDPHEYEPKPADVSAAADADIIFHNGLNLETGGNGWFTKLVATSHKEFDVDAFAVSDKVLPQHLTTNVNEVDPHAWLDLANGIKYVQRMTQIMQEKDHKNADFYQKNAAAYIAKLARLHKSAQSKFADIPERQRLLVTSEGAFKYFAQAYQLKAAYIWEINTEAQGTPEQMQQVLAKISQSEVKSLFVESSVSPKSMEKVAKESGLSIYAKIFTDSLASKGKTGDTYYSMMKWNLDQIHAGLAAVNSR